MFSDCSCDWQMGKKAKGRVQKHATRAKSAREGSDAEESESGDLSGTSSEKQRLFETRAMQSFGSRSKKPSVWLAK